MGSGVETHRVKASNSLVHISRRRNSSAIYTASTFSAARSSVGGKPDRNDTRVSSRTLYCPLRYWSQSEKNGCHVHAPLLRTKRPGRAHEVSSLPGLRRGKSPLILALASVKMSFRISARTGSRSAAVECQSERSVGKLHLKLDLDMEKNCMHKEMSHICSR